MTKWLALLFMILDHIGVFFYEYLPVELTIYLRLLGRLSFPMFAYYVVLGVNRTSDKRKYLYRMTWLALLSQIILAFIFPYKTQLNVLFGFSLYIIYSMIYKNKHGKYIVILLFFISYLTEYSYPGFLIFIIFNYIYNNDINNKNIWATLVILLSFGLPVLFKEVKPFQLFAALSGFVMFNPKFEQRILSKNVEKAIFYIYYPTQWIIFYLIALFM